MKNTVNVGIGGKSFIVDEDAYKRLNNYLSSFEGRLDTESGKEIMDELEERIGELLSRELSSPFQTVSLALVNNITSQLGMPDGEPEFENDQQNTDNTMRPAKKLYLDQENKKIAGVCSGLALYLDVDVTVIRIIFLVALICFGCGFWIYIIIWVVAPKAITPAQKCELRGWPTTAQNLSRFTENRKQYGD